MKSKPKHRSKCISVTFITSSNHHHLQTQYENPCLLHIYIVTVHYAFSNSLFNHIQVWINQPVDVLGNFESPQCSWSCAWAVYSFLGLAASAQLRHTATCTLPTNLPPTSTSTPTTQVDASYFHKHKHKHKHCYLPTSHPPLSLTLSTTQVDGCTLFLAPCTLHTGTCTLPTNL